MATAVAPARTGKARREKVQIAPKPPMACCEARETIIGSRNPATLRRVWSSRLAARGPIMAGRSPFAPMRPHAGWPA